MTGQAWVWVVLAIIVALLARRVINRSRSRSAATVGSSAPAAAPPAAPPRAEPPVAAPVTEAAPPEAVPSSAESDGVAPAAVPVVPDAPQERASVPALAALDSATPPRAPAPAAAVPLALLHPGAALPDPDGSAPSDEYVIKAVDGSKRFHDPGSPIYAVLRADLYFRDPRDASAAGFLDWKAGRKGAAVPAEAAPQAPYPGAVLPDADGSAPSGYRIKAVEGSKRYHDPSSPVYAVLRADVLFRDPDAARAAGYRYWRSKR